MYVYVCVNRDIPRREASPLLFLVKDQFFSISKDCFIKCAKNIIHSKGVDDSIRKRRSSFINSATACDS